MSTITAPDLEDELRPASAIPTSQQLSRARDRYPTDYASQSAIEQKVERRSGPGWTPIPLPRLVEGIEGLLTARVGDTYRVDNPRFLTGGASKIQVAFDLVDNASGHARGLLLRMDPPETLNATNKRSEYELSTYASQALPVPECLWVDESAEFLPEPALIYALVPGVPKPSKGAGGNVTGIGINFGPGLRPALADQFADSLAALHLLDVSGCGTDAVAVPRVGTTESALWRLNFERQLWELDRLEDIPLMDVAGSWLARNAPELDHASLVHGDYRSGNFLFDEETAQLTAWLDWESAHIGDRHLDLAYSMQDHFGHFSEDGETFLVAGLTTAESLIERYEASSGLVVDRDRLRWYRMLTNYASVVKTIATSRRVALLGRSHQDILLARFDGIAPTHLRLLEADLREVL